MVMHHNNNYIVRPSKDNDRYLVINKISEVVEFEDKALPKCVIVADQYDAALQSKDTKEPTTGELIPFKPR